MLDISTESSQNAPRVPPHPPKPGDKGVMQVGWAWGCVGVVIVREIRRREETKHEWSKFSQFMRK